MRRDLRPVRPAPGCPEPDALSLESLFSPENQDLGSRTGRPDSAQEEQGGCAQPARPEEASTHLRSEVEEEGDAADDLAQPQPQEGHEHGAGGGCGLVWRGRRGRLRGVQGALVRGAGAAAAHLVGASQVLGVVSAGAAHGARPARSGARLPLTRRFAGLPAANSKGSAGPARGQAGLDVGRSEPGAAPGRAGERAGRPAAPTLINLLERAGLGSQSALGEAACSTPTSGSPSFLSPSLSFLLSHSKASSPSALRGGGCGLFPRFQRPLAHRSLPFWIQEMHRGDADVFLG